MTNSYRKESPLAGFAGFGGGAPGLSYKSAATKTYVDEVFSAYLYDGNGNAGASQNINNGIDLSGEGGMIWAKSRNFSDEYDLFDTVRGNTKRIRSDTSGAEATMYSGQDLTSFNSDGFSLGEAGSAKINWPGNEIVSWSFRKAPGFFDIVTYTGDNTAGRQIAHSLGSVPGMIIVKRLSGASNWAVYHRGTDATGPTTAPEDYWMTLNENYARQDQPHWNDTKPTSTHFTVGNDYEINGPSSQTYVAYLFAGGESTAATATSCNFLGSASDGNDNKIWVGNASDKTSDFVYGTGDFTWEAWFKPEDSGNLYKRILHHGHEWNQNNTIALIWDHTSSNNKLTFWSYALDSSNPILTSFETSRLGTWNHVAVTRSSGTFRLFVNGNLESTNTSQSASIEGSETTNYATIGATHNLNQNECFKGNISNVRIVKGTAVYTESFRPPTEPLTNITNTVLLCCNGSSTTSATVTPKTLVSDATVTIDTSNSPFDDPGDFKFGDNSEGIVKCGSYTGNNDAGTNDTTVVTLGWEPQWVMIKRTSGTEGWAIFDSMRGVVTAGNDNVLEANTSSDESDSGNYVDFTPMGFNARGTSNLTNKTGNDYIYMAIRRPDGYVGKPSEAGTNVFAMDTGNNSGTIPCFDSGFAADYALSKLYAGTQYWQSTARLTNHGNFETNSNRAEEDYTGYIWDSNSGVHINQASSVQAWMWKRHAGFDVVTYEGTGSAQSMSHSLNNVPEMIWVKNRTSVADWTVYHKDLTSIGYYLKLNTTMAQGYADTAVWNNIAPTSTHFTLGTSTDLNQSGSNHIAMLFNSVTGISKVGSYTGNGSTTGPTITTGFSPRFILLKDIDNGGTNWYLLDTLRGLSAGDDKRLSPNSTSGQDTGDYIDTSSTGFQLVTDWDQFNGNSTKFIYYAHA